MPGTRRSTQQRSHLTERTSVRHAFDAKARSRGNAYFKSGMVLGATAIAPYDVKADVMGSSLYEARVRLDEDSGELSVFCSCPVGREYDVPCKHLWAVLREIDARDLLPANRRSKKLRVRLAHQEEDEDVSTDDEDDYEDDYEDDTEWTDDDDDDDDESYAWPRKFAEVLAGTASSASSVSSWQRAVRLERARAILGRPSGAKPTFDAELDQPRAVLDALLVRRSRALSGSALPALQLFALLHVEEAPEAPVRLSLLAPIPGGYRQLHPRELLAHARPGTLEGELALLALQLEQEFSSVGGSDPLSSARAPYDVLLPWSDTARLLEHLAEAGRLLAPVDRNTVAPVTFSREVATLSLRVVVEPAEAGYRIVPRVFVGEREAGFGALRFVHGSGAALFDSTMVSVRSPSEAEWMATLSQSGARDLVLAADELESFLERYYGEPDLPDVELPLGLELVVCDEAPQRFVDIGASDGSVRGVPLDVGLRYRDKELPLRPARPWVVDLAARVRYRREPELEATMQAELEQLGVRLPPSYASDGEQATGETFRIGAKRVHELASQLLGKGWRVSVQRKAYRRVGGFHLRASSGIDWLEISGTFEVDGQELPLGELLRALQRRRRLNALLELDSDTVAVGAEDFVNRIERLVDLGASLEPSKGVLRLTPAHAGAAVALLETATSSEQDAGFSKLRQALERGLLPRSMAAPRGFRGTLREYQRHGLGWLRWLEEVGFGGCLADDMGLGKTIQVLALLVGRGRRRGPSLVVAPRSVLHNWSSEARRFAPALDPVVHWGPERTTSSESLRDCRLVITTYATLARDIQLLSEVSWDYLVVDEAQVIKNPRTQSAMLVRNLESQHRIALTGTPVENHLDELWALLDFLNPGFGRRAPFKSGSLSESEIALVRALIKPFILRRTKGQVAQDLPERVEQTLEVELSRSERRRYDELVQKLRRKYAQAVAELGIQRSTPVLLTGLLRLRQAACHQGLLDEKQRTRRSSKLAVLLERLRELREEGAKSLVFSQFTEHLDLVESELEREGIPFVRLDGKTRRRAERVRAFQEDASVVVFLISLKAGGTGLNLTAAEYVFLLDPWWNPAAEAQAIDRAHRIGQTSRVIAYRLIAVGTVEEKVAALQERKRDLVESVFGDEQAFLGKLSHDDLTALLHG